MMNESEIRKLLLDYRDIKNRLYDSKIIRTGKVEAEYGEHFVMKLFELDPAETSVNHGSDAKDKNGKLYEIKTRKLTKWHEEMNFPPLSKVQRERADFAILIKFDDDWNPIELYKIPVKGAEFDKKGRIKFDKSSNLVHTLSKEILNILNS